MNTKAKNRAKQVWTSSELDVVRREYEKSKCGLLVVFIFCTVLPTTTTEKDYHASRLQYPSVPCSVLSNFVLSVFKISNTLLVILILHH